MLLTNKVEETYTIEDFIELGKDVDDITYKNFSILAKASTDAINPIYYAEHNILYDYEEECKILCRSVEMTDLEFNKYRFKPKLLSYDLYGSTELFFIILFINGIYNIKDFNRKNIKLIHKKDLSEFLELIYNAERNYIDLNRTLVNYTD